MEQHVYVNVLLHQDAVIRQLDKTAPETKNANL